MARRGVLRGPLRGLALAVFTALSTLSGCAVVDWEQRRWIFMPTTARWAPGEAAAHGMQEVWIEHVSAHPEVAGQTLRLHGLWLPQAPRPDAPVMLFLHGVRWDVRASAPRMRQWHALGFAVLGLDYRGFGRSSDAMPSEDGVAEDARAAWAWLAAQHPQAARYVAGHSLGGAVAVRLAAEVDDEAGLIVEGGFTSTRDVLRSTRWGWLPVAPLITQHFDAGSRIGRVGSPVLVLHAADDTMIDITLGQRLYEQALPPKAFVRVEGAQHENLGAVGRAQVAPALQRLFGIGP